MIPRLLWSVVVMSAAVACGGPPNLSDTWTWDGHDWTEESSSQSPSWRDGAIYVYDAAANEIVLFGGSNSNGDDLSETWTWDGHWTLQNPKTSPPARVDAAGAYDPIRRNVVMFGGVSNGAALADTWTWNGKDWTEAPTDHSPPATRVTRPESAAFDPISGHVILINRCEFMVPESCVKDTWSWDGRLWSQEALSSAAALHQPTPGLIAYTSSGILYTNTARGRVIMLGGDVPLEWDGTAWVADSVSSELPGRAGGGVAYDPQMGAPISFGGDICNGPPYSSDDTWEWNAGVWRQLKPQTQPPARSTTYVTYDSKNKRIVMFGGYVRQGGCSYGLPF